MTRQSSGGSGSGSECQARTMETIDPLGRSRQRTLRPCTLVWRWTGVMISRKHLCVPGSEPKWETSGLTRLGEKSGRVMARMKRTAKRTSLSILVDKTIISPSSTSTGVCIPFFIKKLLMALCLFCCKCFCWIFFQVFLYELCLFGVCFVEPDLYIYNSWLCLRQRRLPGAKEKKG